jgi:hypothetical protein
MRSPARFLLLGYCLLLGVPSTALAGMPSVTLSDVAKVRLQAISFFLAAFLLSA